MSALPLWTSMMLALSSKQCCGHASQSHKWGCVKQHCLIKQHKRTVACEANLSQWFRLLCEAEDVKIIKVGSYPFPPQLYHLTRQQLLCAHSFLSKQRLRDGARDGRERKRQRKRERERERGGEVLFSLASMSAAMRQGCGQWQINVCVKVSSLYLSARVLEDRLLRVEWDGTKSSLESWGVSAGQDSTGAEFEGTRHCEMKTPVFSTKSVASSSSVSFRLCLSPVRQRHIFLIMCRST